MLAATTAKCHVNCACHRLSTSINTAWEAATEECDELAALDTNSNSLVKFVKKSDGIQYNLPATLKSGGKTRPWRSLINKFSSILTSYEALRPLLRDKRREDFITSIENSLLEEVLGILKKAESTFDLLKFSFVPTLHLVLPSFYQLHNFWSETKATDTAVGHILKRNLVMALDGKMWKDIVALHVTATWLDPTLKSFSFVGNSEERQALLHQAETVIEGHAIAAASDLYQKTEEDDREVTAEDQENDTEEVTEVEEEKHAKRCKHDPLLEFRNSTMGEQPGAKLKKFARDLKTEVYEEIRRYKNIGGVSLHQANAARIIFDPLVWWGEQRYSFPILSHVARTILVISASSAESERHFSGAGRIACKDRNRLKDDAVENSVIFYEGIRKGII